MCCLLIVLVCTYTRLTVQEKVVLNSLHSHLITTQNPAIAACQAPPCRTLHFEVRHPSETAVVQCANRCREHGGACVEGSGHGREEGQPQAAPEIEIEEMIVYYI